MFESGDFPEQVDSLMRKYWRQKQPLSSARRLMVFVFIIPLKTNWPASGWVEAGRSAVILTDGRKLHSTGDGRKSISLNLPRLRPSLCLKLRFPILRPPRRWDRRAFLRRPHPSCREWRLLTLRPIQDFPPRRFSNSPCPAQCGPNHN